MKSLFPASIGLISLLSGCASGLPGMRPLTYVTPGEAHVFATGEKCPHEPVGKEFGGLAAAAITGVASQLLKNFGTTLSEGAKGGALTPSISTLNLQLEPGKVPKCVVIVRGAFQPSDKSRTTVDLGSYLGLATDAADARTRLATLNIPQLYRVDYYIELRVGASENSKALTFAPLFMQIDKSIDGATKGERDVSIALKFGRVGSEAAIGSAILVSDRKLGAPSSWEPLGNGRYLIEAPWFGTFHASPTVAGIPAATTAAPAQAQAAAKPQAANRARGATPPLPDAREDASPVGEGGLGAGGGDTGLPTLPGSTIPTMQSKSPSAVPVTLTATVVETRPTNEGLAFVASVFGGLQPQIEAKLKPLIDSEARQAAVDAEATAELNAQAELAAARGTAEGALISYCSASSPDATAAGRQDRITKSQAARAAQLKANVSAIKAAEAYIYDAIVVVSANLPSAVNAGPCTGK